jgi:signal transduction histidine kinase
LQIQSSANPLTGKHIMIDSTAIATLQMLMNTGDGRQAVLAELLQTVNASRPSTEYIKQFKTKPPPRYRVSSTNAAQAEIRRMDGHHLHLLADSPSTAKSQIRLTDKIIQMLDRLSEEDKKPLINFAEGFAYHYNNLFMAIVGYISIVTSLIESTNPAHRQLRDCEERLHNTALLIRLLVDVFHRTQRESDTAYPIDLNDNEISNRIFKEMKNQDPSVDTLFPFLGTQKILRIIAFVSANRLKRILDSITTQINTIFLTSGLKSLGPDYHRPIQVHLKRGIWIAEALFDFAAIVKPKLRPFNLNRTLKEALSTYKRCFSSLKINFCDNAPPIIINGNSLLFQKMIFELLSNSHDVCRHGGEVNIKLRIVDKRIDSDNIRHIAPQKEAHLVVEDTGPGFPAGLGDSIFQPFTSASIGRKNRGLGLAVVAGVVKSHDGRIRYFNQHSGGGVLNMTFPL